MLESRLSLGLFSFETLARFGFFRFDARFDLGFFRFDARFDLGFFSFQPSLAFSLLLLESRPHGIILGV